MRLHLEALVLLQRVWGSFGLITAASLGTLAIGAETALVQAEGSLGPAGRGTVGVLTSCAIAVGAGALAAFLAARGLRRRRATGRLGALALALPNLLIVPFGTALGVYTLWVLLNNDARRDFGRPPRTAPGTTGTTGTTGTRNL